LVALQILSQPLVNALFKELEAVYGVLIEIRTDCSLREIEEKIENELRE